MKLLTVVLLLAIFSLAFPKNALAYIDPGLGSFFIQMLIASVLGAAYFLKHHWLRLIASIKNVFAKPGKKNDT